MTAWKLNTNGFSSQTQQIVGFRSHQPRLSRCQSLSRTRSRSTRLSVKLMIYQEQMIRLSKAAPGPSSNARRSNVIPLKLGWIWAKRTKCGSISERTQLKPKHNLRKILQIHDTILRVTFSIRSQSQLLLPPGNHTVLLILRISIPMRRVSPRQRLLDLLSRSQTLPGQRSHMYTSPATAVRCIALIQRLTMTSKNSSSDQPQLLTHLVLILVIDKPTLSDPQASILLQVTPLSEI